MSRLLQNDLSQLVINNSTEGIIIFNTDLRIRMFNPAMEKVSGLQAHEVIDRSLFEVFPFLRDSGEDIHIYNTLKGNTSHSKGKRYYFTKIGKTGYFEAKYFPLINAEENIEGGSIFFCDISDSIYNEERFQYIANATNDAVWEWVLSTNKIWWSDGMQRLFGYSATDLEGSFEWWESCVHPVDLARVNKSLEDVVKNKEPIWTAEYRFRKKNGEYAYVLDRGELLFNENGEPVKMVGGIKDMTEKELAKQELKSRESFYKTILENAFDGISIIDEIGILKYESPSNEKLNGFKHGEMLGLNTIDLVHPEDREKVYKDLEDVIKNPGVPFHVVYRFIHKNGEYRYVSSVVVNMLDDPAIKGILVNFQDITNRRLAEKALIESEERNRAVLHALPDIIFVLDAEDHINEYYAGENPLFDSERTITGCDLKKSMKPRVYSSIKKILKGPLPNTPQEVTFKNDEHTCYFEIILLPYKDNGKLVVARDVTETKIANEKLQAEQERLQLALQGADLGLWDWDIVNNNIVYNNKWAEMLGYQLDELKLGLNTWEDLIHPEDYSRIQRLLNDHLTGKAPFYESEYRLRAKDGDWRWILDRGKVLEKDNAGKPTRALGIHFDITERKKAIEALSRSEEQFRQLFQNSPIGLLILNEEEQIINTNKAFTDIFQYEEKDIKGKNVGDIFTEVNHLQERKKITSGVLSGKVIKLETERPRKNGEMVPVILYAVPVVIAKKLVRIFGIYVDITERKAAEEELHLLTNELLRSNRELEQFAYIASHNLRSPVANLKGLLSLQNQAPELSNDNLILEKIEHSVNQLDNTLQDLIEIVTLKNSIDKKFELIDLDAITQNVLSDIEEMVKESQAKIITDFKQVRTVHYPYIHLQSIFQNLFTNAIKYSSPERKPVIKVKSIKKNGVICISIRDNGIGIDIERHREKLFKMYQRFNNEKEGKGLGLYIVKNQLELLGGNIEVESEVNKGTEFIIYLKEKPV